MSDLLGKPVVLYFYPRRHAGCTPSLRLRDQLPISPN